MNNKNLFTKLMAMLLVVVMMASMFVACNPAGSTDGDKSTLGHKDPKNYTYTTYLTLSPSNWNELTYQDNNDTEVMSWIGSSFFIYDFKYDENGEIIPGEFEMEYSAATKLEDVTSTVDAKWGYTEEQKAEGGYAWKITLRDDLKWDDGTKITAADFEYSMKAQLDPDFMNFRANTYYDTLMVKNSYEYFYQKAPSYAPAVPAYDAEPDYSIVESGCDLYMNVSATNMTLVGYSLSYLVENYVGTEAALAALDVIASAANEYGYTLMTEENYDAAIELLYYALLPFSIDFSTFSAEEQYAWYVEALFYVSGYGTETPWESVGMYAIPEENAIVVCLDKSYQFLMPDGSLSYLAAYYMSSLPLVKQDIYDDCKQEPAAGATLWTSNYNSSLETTASWGPYKLVEFEAGSHYVLKINENWYGWNMEQYKNQYNVTAINCRKVEEFNTRWMGFLKGIYDDASLDTSNVEEYLNSKYVSFAATTGTYGMQLYSNLEVLALSENNNGILAIDEFRQAFNLALDRKNVIESIWPGTTAPCFGLVNTEYYYDIENSPYLEDGGKYRNTTEAKEGILRAYGYTQDVATGLWSVGDLEGMELNEAYNTLTGYNPELAKVRMQQAIDELLTNAEKYGYDSSKKITLVYGASVENDKQHFRVGYLQNVLNTLTAGTALEGQIEVVLDASAGSEWAEAFRSGATQIGFGYGFSGNAFNPFDIIGAFVNPDDSLNYHAYWDTSLIDLTITMPEGEYEGAGETITMDVQNWYFCLNGIAEENESKFQYNWDAGMAPTEARLTILAALEELVIKESRSVMLIADAGGSFLGAKFNQFQKEYHTFMGFGGIRYMEVAYTDAEWLAFVDANNGDLSTEYKKSE